MPPVHGGFAQEVAAGFESGSKRTLPVAVGA